MSLITNQYIPWKLYISLLKLIGIRIPCIYRYRRITRSDHGGTQLASNCMATDVHASLVVLHQISTSPLVLLSPCLSHTATSSVKNMVSWFVLHRLPTISPVIFWIWSLTWLIKTPVYFKKSFFGFSIRYMQINTIFLSKLLKYTLLLASWLPKPYQVNVWMFFSIDFKVKNFKENLVWINW